MEAQQSNFQFTGYRIVKSLIEVKGEPKSRGFSVAFAPAGVIYEKESKFVLSLQINITDKTGEVKVEVIAEGVFKFDNNLPEKDLDGFFYTNASAILFPYVRAYIATLTTLSGESIVMPTMNLTQSGEALKKHTERK